MQKKSTINISSKTVKESLDKLVEACKPNQSERNGLPLGYRVPKHKLIAKLCVYADLKLLTEHDLSYYYWRIQDEYEKYTECNPNSAEIPGAGNAEWVTNGGQYAV